MHYHFCCQLQVEALPTHGHVPIHVGVALQVVNQPGAASTVVVQSAALHPTGLGRPTRTTINPHFRRDQKPVRHLALVTANLSQYRFDVLWLMLG